MLQKQETSFIIEKSLKTELHILFKGVNILAQSKFKMGETRLDMYDYGI